ncbi:hypothetical protein SAMN05192588_0268 [Nonlabens sp. Hel1_33_55]|uniref:hypothetical protein n=1 Tax=Nonlabens sp. Hel1_33_55 TaxID=1336802 RepID=UPI000875CBBD|nr:hypothetical protein [Nonlabens sp. Hel1_33_55]SCX92028.1 hypothetical protein SAMN05192588_0268 [Nonlabens sp. Hel1_33_55]
MKKRLLGNLTVILIIFTIVVVPFGMVFEYVQLSQDDLGRAYSNFENYSQNFDWWMSAHNGRFFNALIALLPIYSSMTSIKLILLLIFLLHPVVLYLVLKKYLKFVGLQIEKSSILLLSMMFFFMMIIQMPLLVEYFYWYAAMTVYSLPFLSFLMLIYFILGIHQSKKGALFGAVFCSLLCVGSNEMFILIINFLLTIQILRYALMNKMILFKYLIIELCVLLSSLIVIFASGTSHRQAINQSGGDFANATMQSIKATLSLLFNQLSSFEDITVILLIIFSIGLFSSKGVNSSRLKYINPIILLAFSLIIIFLVLFVPAYATGGIGYNHGRIANLIQISLLMTLVINAINFGIYILSKGIRWNISKYYYGYTCLLVVFIIFISFRDENLRGLYQDFNENRFEVVEGAIDQRTRILLKAKNGKVEVPKLSHSNTLPYMDITEDSKHWYNRVYVEYVNHKYEINIQSIVLQYEKSDTEL